MRRYPVRTLPEACESIVTTLTADVPLLPIALKAELSSRLERALRAVIRSVIASGDPSGIQSSRAIDEATFSETLEQFFTQHTGNPSPLDPQLADAAVDDDADRQSPLPWQDIMFGAASGASGGPTTAIASAMWRPPPVITRYRPDEIKRAIETFLATLQSLPLALRETPKACRDALDELLSAPNIWKQASEFSLGLATDLAEMAVGPISSGLEQGGKIHQHLQARYRSLLIPALVAQDNRIYGTLAKDPATGTPLYQLAWKRDSLPSIDALSLASKADFLTRLPGKGTLRADTLDFGTRAVWEIKPLNSAFYAGAQEFWYRHSYNIAASFIEDTAQLGLRHSTVIQNPYRPLRSGTAFPGVSELRSLHIPGSGFESLGHYVIPVTIREFPGLVLYFVLDNLNKLLKTAWAAIAALLGTYRDWLDAAASKLKKLWSQVEGVAPTVPQWLSQAFLYLFVVVIIVAAIIAVIKAGAFLGAAAVVLVIAGALTFLFQSPSDKEQADTHAAGVDLPPLLNVNFGPVHLVNCPTRTLLGGRTRLLTRVERAVVDGLSAAFPVPTT
jgi:hypothetical protein